MPKYKYKALVKRICTDVVSVHVDADNDEEAVSKALNALETFPDKHYEDGVDYCWIENREYHVNEVLKLEEKD